LPVHFAETRPMQTKLRQGPTQQLFASRVFHYPAGNKLGSRSLISRNKLPSCQSSESAGAVIVSLDPVE
jgi:hypothetical protein